MLRSVGKVLNNRLVERLDKGTLLHEGQAGFRLKRCCIDRLREDKTFFLDVQKGYGTVWRDWFVVEVSAHGCEG